MSYITTIGLPLAYSKKTPFFFFLNFNEFNLIQQLDLRYVSYNKM